MSKQHFKKYGATETGAAWSLLLTDTSYRHHFSESELYSIKAQLKVNCLK